MSKRATGAVVAMAAILMVATSGSQAIATQGEPVLAGEINTETDATWFWNTETMAGCGTPGSFAVVACGGIHALSVGPDVAISALQDSPNGLAILGEAAAGGTGVKGLNTGANGIGVWGQSPGTGSAVYGEATGTGVGVHGDTTNGTGVIAESTNGTALSVKGKAKFSRSGKVVIARGATSRTITLAGVTTASMVLATSQQNATVFVRSVVPGIGSFTIRLSGTAPSAGLKVAYFVLN